MSAVVLERIETQAQAVLLHLKGVDFLDQTPVLDIKPYIPYADSIPVARSGFVSSVPPTTLGVVFSDEASQFCQEQECAGYPGLRQLIVQLLAQDPRPAYHKHTELSGRLYGMRLFDFNIKWQFEGGRIRVHSLENRSTASKDQAPNGRKPV